MKKGLTPFKSAEARVVGGRKVVERRGLQRNWKELKCCQTTKLQERNSFYSSSSSKLQMPLPNAQDPDLL